VALALERDGITQPNARDIFNLVCDIRSAKLPDPTLIGNAGSFFKNPVVDEKMLNYVLDIDGNLVYYALDDGRYKLAAGWLIDACGWKGRQLGDAAVYDKQALVIVNRGAATGSELWQLAQAVQKSVYQRFGVQLEPEPVVL
jgi:UDP-N-acetylmuramate dehydrogenase